MLNMAKSVNVCYNTLAKLKKDEYVSMENIGNTCRSLDRNINDVIDIVHNKENK